MPCWELFEEQSQDYRDEVLPSTVSKRVAVEAGVPQGWDRYVGLSGVVVGLDRFGASAPGDVVMRELGFTVENVVSKARGLL
jgi:transketolase